MKATDFSQLPNFTYTELLQHYYRKGFKDAPAEIDKIKKSLFIKLQRVRTQIDRPIHINCITEGKHAKNSSHYTGRAIDWRVGGKGKVNYNKLLQACIDAGFTGIGWYPHWETPGFHTDIRTGGVKVWTRDKKGNYKGLI